MSRRKWIQMLVVTAVTACLLLFSGLLSAQGNSEQAFERVREVQERNTAWLMALPGVVGTAIGEDESARPIVLLLLEHGAVAGIPPQLDGVLVRPLVTGKIVALQKGKPGGGSEPSPTSRWPRPVPIGVSTGNANENSAGTIGCRVKDGSGNLYALSNNHVYARENNAAIGEEVLQPGRYDGGKPGEDHLGNLSVYVPIVFSTSAENTVDAAIALTTADLLRTSTPANGYGTPNSGTTVASLNQKVQKYGRTTGLTKGSINGINATVNVGYSSGTARFVNQIIVYSRTSAFIKAGDSGSLLVTDNANNSPVGLLFAGDSSGKYGIANPIVPVLNAFGVTIDGK